MLQEIISEFMAQMNMQQLQIKVPGLGVVYGPEDADVALVVPDESYFLSLGSDWLERLTSDIVTGVVEVEGSLAQLMAATATMVAQAGAEGPPLVWQKMVPKAASLLQHSRGKDADQIRHHYDLSNDFFALWLDPRRVYSGAYYREPGLDLAAAQEAKLDLICRKLDLRPGQRFLDVGAGWGALLIWAAERYGVTATGITLSQSQFDYTRALIAERGLEGRVEMRLLDYRDLAPEARFDRIAAVGMFEHVGRANLPFYFQKICAHLEPGGLFLNQGITAGVTRAAGVVGGAEQFIARYIFPGGELFHIGYILSELAAAGLEMVDTENLRPHYARTLHAWSDALEARLPDARAVLEESQSPAQAAQVLNAYRLYLAGCAMAFEQGWVSLHHVLAMRPWPEGAPRAKATAAPDGGYPFTRDYIYRA